MLFPTLHFLLRFSLTVALSRDYFFQAIREFPPIFAENFSKKFLENFIPSLPITDRKFPPNYLGEFSSLFYRTEKDCGGEAVHFLDSFTKIPNRMQIHTFKVSKLEVEKRLVEEVHNNDVLIIVGETGSGKTTLTIYPILLPRNLTPAQSNRVCNALALL
ncbi:hypothetical protein ACS0TY_018699 [Phlomoides rotata]